VATEKHLYNLLAQREMAFVSVGHRPTLRSFHDTVLERCGVREFVADGALSADHTPREILTSALGLLTANGRADDVGLPSCFPSPTFSRAASAEPVSLAG
jgi:hypothetical protein